MPFKRPLSQNSKGHLARFQAEGQYPLRQEDSVPSETCVSQSNDLYGGGNERYYSTGYSVEAPRRLVDPIPGNVTPIYEYEPNTWGAPEAGRIIACDDGWHNPKPEEAIG
jgi:hypothetical protein